MATERDVLLAVLMLDGGEVARMYQRTVSAEVRPLLLKQQALLERMALESNAALALGAPWPDFKSRDDQVKAIDQQISAVWDGLLDRINAFAKEAA